MALLRSIPNHRPSRDLLPLLLLLATLALLTHGSVARAQQQRIEDMKGFDAGDLKYRTHVHLEFASRTSAQCVIMPPEGFSGEVFRARTDGSPGWGQMLKSRGFNAYLFDHVGCGSSWPPPSRDLTRLTDKGVWGAYQILVATRANLVIAQGFSAGFAIKGRSQAPDAGFSFVLIDPVGPPGAQSRTQLTTTQVAERQSHLEDSLWSEWGWGRKAHRLGSGTDLNLEMADQTLSLYERDQPNYRMALLTGLQAGAEVNEKMNLKDVPMLVVRTTAADPEQVRREEQVVTWLKEAGCQVDRMDLGEIESTRRTTGLPWAGEDAEAVLELFLEWYRGLGIPDVVPRTES